MKIEITKITRHKAWYKYPLEGVVGDFNLLVISMKNSLSRATGRRNLLQERDFSRYFIRIEITERCRNEFGMTF